MRIRVSGSPLLDDVLRSLGAVPVRIKWLDAQNAMLGGTLDGQEVALQTFVATKAYTLGQKQVTLLALAADPLIVAVSRVAWDAWTAEDRETVRQAGVEAAARETVLARSAAAAANSVIVSELKSAGVTVTRLTSQERAAFGAATSAVFDKWASDVGADLVRRAQEAITDSRGR